METDAKNINVITKQITEMSEILTGKQVVPPITNELGRSWMQPKTDNWLFDNKSVIMSKRDFEELAEYSCTNPSAVYEGKCWKRHVERKSKGIDKWFLCFVLPDTEDSRYVLIDTREILIVD